MNLRSRFLAILTAIILLTGCGVSKRLTVSRNPKFTLQAALSNTVNGTSPLPVDFVMITDKKLVKELAKLTAKDWFERRMQIQRDFPDKTTVVSWEWPPGTRTGPISFELSSKIQAAFLFANYPKGGDQRAVIDLRTPVIVDFQEYSFTVQPLR